MVRYLAEISVRTEKEIQATPANQVSRVNNVYYINIGPPPTDSYWIDWGGTYDEYVGTQIELYYSRFLRHVDNLDEVKTTPYTLFIDTSNYFVYFNIPQHPWLYADYSAEGENVIPFISSALDPDNPSRNIVRGVAAETRLGVPSFTVKISETISGITLNQGFSIDLHNNDGYFDDDDIWDLFNTPVHLKKAIVENPSYEDFKEIRGGYAGSTRTTFDKFTIDAEDKIYSLSEPVCDVIKQENFQDFVLNTDAIGKSIPVIYGTKKVKLVKLDNANHFIGAEYISTLGNVYDKDGNIISATFNGIVITAAGAVSAIITGYTTNAIGEIIKDLVTRKTSIGYNNSNWNTQEVSDYIAMSPQINIVFTSGDVKKAINDTLKSDMAYFIQLTGGRLTIRRWGEVYGGHEIPSWVTTQKPDKNFDKAKENYFSSCLIKYGFTETDRNTFDTYLYDDEQSAAESRYRKVETSEFETDLINDYDARNLAMILGGRYTTMRQKLKIAIGMDTTPMELLDIVTFNPVINNRLFSKPNAYIITEINPAQDILTLEEIDPMILEPKILIADVVLADTPLIAQTYVRPTVESKYGSLAPFIDSEFRITAPFDCVISFNAPSFCVKSPLTFNVVIIFDIYDNNTFNRRKQVLKHTDYGLIADACESFNLLQGQIINYGIYSDITGTAYWKRWNNNPDLDLPYLGRWEILATRI